MANAAIQLLILHKQLSFSLKIKRTLEQIGGFEVSPFTTLETAMDFLKENRQHVALIDFTLPGVSGLDIVLKFRSVQPKIIIIASPDVPQVAAVVKQMNLSGIVDSPIGARELIPVLRDALKKTKDKLPQAVENFILSGDSDTMPAHDDRVIVRTQPVKTEKITRKFDPEEHAKTIEFVLKADIETLRDSGELPGGISEKSAHLFQQLAAEEPPMPTLAETGTIHDLHTVVDRTSVEKLTEVRPTPPPSAPPPSKDTAEKTFAESALRIVNDDNISLEQLKDALRMDFPDTQGLQPLPSWMQSLERYVNEPDFLEDTAALRNPLDNYAPNEMSLPEAPIEHPQDLSTEVLPQSSVPSQPPAPAPKQPLPTTLPEEKHPAELPAYAFQAEANINADPADDESEQVQIAKMALNFTQASLELTAEMSVLAHEGRIVAHAGILPIEEIEDINELVAEDWEAQPGEARIRFITLPSSGRDYMIHSRRTEDGFTLSLIFAGNMPLRIIRNQSDKLLNALTSIPELPAPSQNLLDALQERELQALEAEAAQEIEAAIETTADIAREHGEEQVRDIDKLPDKPAKAIATVKAAYTFVWMTHNADASLDARVIRLLMRELESQLTEAGWTVENLQVYEDYIYLMADVPGEATSNAIVADLKQRAAWIAHSIDSTIAPDKLWADGYCVLAPGREMDTDEIQRYINFARL